MSAAGAPLPELSRVVRVSDAARMAHISVEATAEERAALARRFNLLALDRLDADVAVRAIAGGLALSGTVHAAVTQACVVSDAPVAAQIAEPFSLRFVRDPGGRHMVDEEGVEGVALEAEDCDTLPLEGEQVDAGEVVAQTLALALPLFPRHPDADALVAERGIVLNQPTGPFAGLAALTRPGADSAK